MINPRRFVVFVHWGSRHRVKIANEVQIIARRSDGLRCDMLGECTEKIAVDPEKV